MCFLNRKLNLQILMAQFFNGSICRKSQICVPWLRLLRMWSSFFFSCDQAALQMVQSVRLPVCQYVCPSHLFKSPRYTGGDFIFLFRFGRRRRRRPQILVHAMTFEPLFRFLSFLAQLLALNYWLTDYILVDFRRDLDLEFSRSNIELAISQPKKVRLPRNNKKTHRLNSSLQMWPLGLTLAMTLTLNFQGQISNWLYLSQKWFDCNETKKKHIDCTLDFKCDHRIWP